MTIHSFPLNEPILAGSPLFDEIHRIVDQNMPKLAYLNNGYHSPDEVIYSYQSCPLNFATKKSSNALTERGNLWRLGYIA